VLAISLDSVYTHKVWNDIELSKMVKGGIPYPILTDLDGHIGKLYDVYDALKGTSLRGTFIIDAEGNIQAEEILTSPVGRNPEEILRLIKAYQSYFSTKESTPCGWNIGDKTINTTLANAGNVWQQWKIE
jgi:alkyl hydroperoxide reductase subunit AhpC